MKKILITLAAVVISGGAIAATFTDIDSPQYEGKTGDKARNAAIDANFALIEAGSESATLASNRVYVGNDSNARTAMGVTGDVTITQDGTNATTAIAAGVIVDADVATNAAIAYSKLDLATSVAPSDLQAALADRIGYITVTGADAATNGTGTVTIQLKDAAGSDLAAAAVCRTWIGTADDYGVDALTDYSVSTGTQKEEVTANGEYLAITDASGTIVMAVDNGGAGTVYAWAEVGGRIVASGAIVLTAP